MLAAFRRAALTRGVMPSNEEIMRLVGAKSISAGPKVLSRLEDAGHITINRLERNGRIVAAADGSWSIANSYARAALARGAVANPNVGPRQAPAQEAASPAPVPRLEAPQSPAHGVAERDDDGGGAAAAGALPATRGLLVVDEAAPVPTAAWAATANRMREEQEAGAREHMSTVGVQNLRAQIAAVSARAGRPSRTCCFPMWPNEARAPLPSIDWDPARHFGPGVFCCDPVAAPGRPYCPRHHAITHTRRQEDTAA